MKTVLALTLALALLMTTAVFAQRGGGRGQGEPRMGAPAAQGAQRGQMNRGQMSQGQRGQNMNHAGLRPPMHPAYRPNYAPHYAPRYGYGYGPRGYYPQGGAYYPYYNSYGYPQVSLAITPGGWAVAGAYSGVNVYYEKQTVVQEGSTATVEVVTTAYVTFEVDALDAEVYVDGAYEGVIEHFAQTPLRLSAGEHRVELHRNGDKMASFKVRLGDGQTVCIRAKLNR